MTITTKTTIGCLAGLLACLLPVLTADASDMDVAIDMALEAKQSDFIQRMPASAVTISNVHLKLFPVSMVDKKGPLHTVAGTIVHEGTNGQTRTVAYRVLKRGGAIKDIQLQIDGEAPQPMSAAMMQALGRFHDSEPIESDERKAIIAGLSKAVDGTWLSVVELIIAHIGIRHC